MMIQNDSVALQPLNRAKPPNINAHTAFVEVNLTSTPLSQETQTVPSTKMDDSKGNFFKVIIDFVILLIGELAQSLQFLR
jgi:hypothetical protein